MMETERCPFNGVDCEYIPLARKAATQADEIERLRAALDRISNSFLVNDTAENILWGCIKIARSALQQRESE